MTASLRFTIPASHPALPGHFPGHPIVPGVLLLDAVVQAARAQFALGPATEFPRAKFLAPVLPDQEVVAEIAQGAPGRVAFTCSVGDRIVATGEAAFAP